MGFDWTTYTGNLKWLPERTICLMKRGSQAYGTSTPESDLDIGGVAIAPKEYYHGFTQEFEDVVQHEPDLAIFEVRKFLTLASCCNPNIIEMLYTEEEDYLLVTPAWRHILEIRDCCLCKSARYRFAGYAMDQMQKIRLHRRWLLYPRKEPPTRTEFKLPERAEIKPNQLAAAMAAVQKQLDKWAFKDLEDLDPETRTLVMERFEETLLQLTHWAWVDREDKQWVAAAEYLGFATNFIEVLDKERRFLAAQKDWTHFLKWKSERNKARAEMEAKFGYDGKNALHLVRLMTMGEEILSGLGVRVRRLDAEKLLKVRRGEWSFEKLEAWFEEKDKALALLMETSPLPKHPDREKINAVCIRVVEESFR